MPDTDRHLFSVRTRAFAAASPPRIIIIFNNIVYRNIAVFCCRIVQTSYSCLLSPHSSLFLGDCYEGAGGFLGVSGWSVFLFRPFIPFHITLSCPRKLDTRALSKITIRVLPLVHVEILFCRHKFS